MKNKHLIIFPVLICLLMPTGLLAQKNNPEEEIWGLIQTHYYKKIDRAACPHAVKELLEGKRASCLDPYSWIIEKSTDYNYSESTLTIKQLTKETHYIHILGFMEKTGEEVEQALRDISSQEAKNIILDLRDNTGGLVLEMVRVARAFAEKSGEVIITAFSVHSTMYDEYITLNSGVGKDFNLVILINQNTGSAAEMLAGSLKILRNAPIIGHKSFGKGLMSREFSLSDGRVLKIVTHEIFLGKKRIRLDKVGVLPDFQTIASKNTSIDADINLALKLLEKRP